MAQNKSEEVKKAVQSALKYYSEIVGKVPITKVRLEEVEFEDFKNEWLITLSWPEKNTADLMPLYAYSDKREYKKFIIDSHDFDVKAMKIFQP